jgi:hypothetical protein
LFRWWQPARRGLKRHRSLLWKSLRDDRGSTILVIGDRNYAAEYKVERVGGSQVAGRDEREKQNIARCRKAVGAEGKGKRGEEIRVREFADYMARGTKHWGTGED